MSGEGFRFSGVKQGVRRVRKKKPDQAAVKKRVSELIKKAKQAAEWSEECAKTASRDWAKERENAALAALEPDSGASTTPEVSTQGRAAESMYPVEPIGFLNGLEAELEAREARYRSLGIKREEAYVRKGVVVRSNRFIPVSAAYSDDFYEHPTDRACLWCTEGFETLPVPLPVRYCANTDVYMVTGQYCSPSCALAAVESTGTVYHRDNIRPIVHSMFRRMYGLRGSLEIIAAPPREALAKFGGRMSVEQFRATGGLGILTRLVTPPMYPFSAGVEEVERVKTVVVERMDNDEVHAYAVRNIRYYSTWTAPARHAFGPAQSRQRRRRPVRGRAATAEPAATVKRKSADVEGAGRPADSKRAKGADGAGGDQQRSEDKGTLAAACLYTPSIREQIRKSDEALRLQKEQIGASHGFKVGAKRRKPNLMDFLLKENNNNNK